MFDRPTGSDTVVIVHLELEQESSREDLSEFKELVLSSGAEIAEVVTGKRSVPDAKYFVGKGKAEEIKQSLQANDAQLVIFNHPLSPAQERNLERHLECRVLDRIGLILDIFAQRARTFEGKLQVELAQLRHLSTRLVRGWSHLERQKGGIGLRGPGETQLESDRRLLRARIKAIHKRLEKVRKQRDQSRRARKRAIVPTVSLVGYTNAGKSTLFNRLTQSDVYIADQLFATLDPTLRQHTLPEVGKVVFADTVGFIRHLPHELVEAFRATLEEVAEADLLLHIIDAHDPQRHEKMEQVQEVLKQIDATDVCQLQVYNKIDLLPDCASRIERDSEARPWRVWISAEIGDGMDHLERAIVEHLSLDMIYRELCLPPAHAGLRAKLFGLGGIVAENMDEQGNWQLSVHLPRVEFIKLFSEKT